MKFYFTILFIVLSLVVFPQKTTRNILKKGEWASELQLSNHNSLPFKIQVHNENQLVVINGDEEIKLEPLVFINDSIRVRFPFFNSELVFSVKNKRKMEGYWINYNKANNYTIPFFSQRKKTTRFSFIDKNSKPANVGGKWKVTFEPGSASEYPAVGIFEQIDENNSVTGTFLTETGDFRYLEGNCSKDSLYLSCFDGSHAFLFKAHVQNDTLYGDFYSGSHWNSIWVAQKNDSFTLTSPEKLTHIVDSNVLTFNFKSSDGSDFSFPNDYYKNKVTIIQLMGTWCPNCLDETKYYSELYEKYQSQGLEIIAVCYEAGNNFDDYVASINRLKEKLKLNYLFLVGGAANKNLASEHFKSLNEIISFPTSIFIGKDSEIKYIHTGFNGPGTGEHYTNYINETNALIEALLKD